jgi:IPT/TIG domain/FG-GAP repeat
MSGFLRPLKTAGAGSAAGDGPVASGLGARALTRPSGVGLDRRALAGTAVLSVLVLVIVLGLSRAHAPVGTPVARSGPLARTGLSSAGSASLASLPAAARGPVSQALGAGSPSYRMSPMAGGFEAVNGPQRLHVRFNRAGVHVGSDGLQLTLSTRMLGRGPAQEALNDVAPRASANRVTYTHAQLSEWYDNGPLGLEQGFTIARPPARLSASASMTLSMAVTGNAHGALSPGSQSVVFSRAGGRPGAPSLRYYDLTATDATGRTLHSWLTLRGDRVVLHLDTAGAQYPLTVDPLIALSERLTGAGEQGSGRFGFSVALSADGDTALVGAPHDDDFAGAAWVFARSGATWVQQGPKLTGQEPVNEFGEERCAEEEPGEEGGACGFGSSVALSADGDTALIGAPRDDENRGAAWVFTRSGSTWSPQQRLAGESEGRGSDRFGRAVALSSSGDIALIGSPGESSYRGAVWTFARSESGNWSQLGEKLTASGEAGAGHFGRSLALSADGNTAVIGAPVNDEYVGAAWVFSRAGASWGQGEELAGTGEIGQGHFGGSVALSGDADTALVGARADNGGQGAVWAFNREGISWSTGQKLTAGAGASESREFGRSVALSGDGELALIGAPHAESHRGQAWVFTRSGATWTATETLEPPEAGATGSFGVSAALSSGGASALIGAPLSDETAGSVWASGPTVAPPLPTVTDISPTSGPSSGGTEVRIQGSGFLAGASVDIGSAASAVDVVSETEIVATTSPSLPGEDEVVVTDSNGSSSGGPGYRYTESTGSVEAPANTTTPGPTARSGVLGTTTMALPPPQLDASANVTSFSGTVLVKLPGSSTFVALSSISQIPFGTIIDATHGSVTITTILPNGTTQTVTLYSGEFMLTQQRNGTVLITLEGGNFSVCPTAKERSHLARTSSTHESGSHVVRKLWANGHGKYTTKGNYASGAVQGTVWLTEDLCDGTSIAVTRDSVLVTNLINHKHFLIKAGHHYLAKAP